jgi:type I restriction enzyme M protein
MVDRTHRGLTNDDIARVTGAYHAWRGEPDSEPYKDVAGFCAAATVGQIAEHRFVLTPGRYVGTEEIEEENGLPGEKLGRLTRELLEAFDEGRRLESQIRKNLARLQDVEQ